MCAIYCAQYIAHICCGQQLMRLHSYFNICVYINNILKYIYIYPDKMQYYILLSKTVPAFRHHTSVVGV